MRNKGFAIILSVLAVALTPSGQQRPNFTGTWIPENGKPSGAETIAHDDKTFTRSHASEGHGHTFVIKLDGTESRNVISSHGEDIVTVSRAVWDGDRLVITNDTTYPDKRKLKSTETWWMDGNGRLNAEFSETMDGRSPTTVKVVYAKKGQTPSMITSSP